VYTPAEAGTGHNFLDFKVRNPKVANVRTLRLHVEERGSVIDLGAQLQT
jgi:hypothetical protein